MLLYLFNKTLKSSINILRALTVLYGINRYQSKQICKQIGINPQSKMSLIRKSHINLLTKYISRNIKIEQFLKRSKRKKLKKLLRIKLNRALRFRRGLPVRGQRTRTNAKTIKKLKLKSIY